MTDASVWCVARVLACRISRCGTGHPSLVNGSFPDVFVLPNATMPNQTFIGGDSTPAIHYYNTLLHSVPIGARIVGRQSSGGVIGAVVNTTLSASHQYLYIDVLIFSGVADPNVIDIIRNISDDSSSSSEYVCCQRLRCLR